MASPSVRLIEDRLINADGTGTAGTIQLSWNQGVSSDGFAIGAGKLVLRLNNGAFSVTLAPGTYTAKYILARGAQRSETWIVPTDPGPFRVSQIRH